MTNLILKTQHVAMTTSDDQARFSRERSNRSGHATTPASALASTEGPGAASCLEKMLALGVDGGRVMLVDEATGEVKWAVQAHAGGNWRASVAMSSDGRLLASVGLDDEHWKLWDAASGAVLRAGARHDGTCACTCKVTDIGGRLLQDGCPVVAHTSQVRAVALSPCGHRLATGGLDSTVILWDAQTGEAEHLLGHSRNITSLSFSVKGEWLASGSRDGSIRVWDVPTGVLFRAIQEPHHNPVLSVHFSPTKTSLLSSTQSDGTIQFWDVDSGERRRGIFGGAFAMCSPDGRTIATASSPAGRDLQLVDVEAKAFRFRMAGHSREVRSASFSQDGSKLASGSSDGTCKVWDSSTGALLQNITVGRPVLSVVWGRDWGRDTLRGEAFAMGQHPRLGAGSQVLAFEVGVVRMILDCV